MNFIQNKNSKEDSVIERVDVSSHLIPFQPNYLMFQGSLRLVLYSTVAKSSTWLFTFKSN
jgi:hypothetical protein